MYTHAHTYIRGRNPKKNSIIFWRAGPLHYRLAPLGKCSRNPSVSVYQVAIVVRGSVWLQWIFLEDFFNAFAHFMMGDVWAHLTTLHWVFSVFDQKQHGPYAPPSLFTQLCPKWLFFLFPQIQKVVKGKCFVDVEEVKQKAAEALKGIKIDESKNCFEQWKNIL